MNKNLFKIRCHENAANTHVEIFNLNGQEIVGIASINKLGFDELEVAIKPGKIKSGVYVMEIKRDNRCLRERVRY